MSINRFYDFINKMECLSLKDEIYWELEKN